MSTEATNTTTNPLQLRPARLNRKAAAQYLGYSPQTLANWAATGRGPKYMRDGSRGSSTFYRLEDLDAWIDAQEVA